MARIIVNEGDGPRSVELEGVVSVGSNPSCDVVLEHPGALGVRLELKPLRYGYRVKLVKGELRLNESACEMADLEHNDTLFVGSGGEVMLLYKQPEGADFQPPASAPGAPAAARPEAGLTPEGLELLDDLEDLEDLEELEELDELQELDELPELEEVDDLEELPELEPMEPAAKGDAPAASARKRGPVEEIDLAPEDPDASSAPPPRPDPGLEEALLRARWKRLEMLRRLQRVMSGELESYPDLRDPGALDIVQQMDLEGRAGVLEQLEREEGLTDASLPQLADKVEEARAAVEAARAAPLAALEELAELEELEVTTEVEPEPATSEPAPAAASEPAELEAIEELDELEDLEELPELSELDEPPAGARPLPPGGIRWHRPLPPGRRAPTFLPPAQPPARPPARPAPAGSPR